jgi:hypothetical protein
MIILLFTILLMAESFLKTAQNGDFKMIEHNKQYIVKESFGDRMITAGTKVKVVEIRESDAPFVYCFGENGGSAYIRTDNLKDEN